MRTQITYVHTNFCVVFLIRNDKYSNVELIVLISKFLRAKHEPIHEFLLLCDIKIKHYKFSLPIQVPAFIGHHGPLPNLRTCFEGHWLCDKRQKNCYFHISGLAIKNNLLLNSTRSHFNFQEFDEQTKLSPSHDLK